MDKTTTRVSMSGKELKKLRVITAYVEGHLSREEAAAQLSISMTQVSRLKKKLKSNGPEGLIHGLCGKSSNASKPEVVKERVLSIFKNKYEPCGFNLSHFHEKLIELEKLSDVGRETVRRWIRGANLSSRKVKRGRKHRSRRERRPRIGEMLQLDTSPHDWLGTGEKLHLIIIVDDATTNILYARLFDRDGSLPNLQVLDYVFRK